jgi:hypothetical protein
MHNMTLKYNISSLGKLPSETLSFVSDLSLKQTYDCIPLNIVSDGPKVVREGEKLGKW